MLKLITIFLLPICLSSCDRREHDIQPPISVNKPATSNDSQANKGRSLLDTEEITDKDRIDKFIIKPPVNDRYIQFGDYRSMKPASWFWKPPTSQIVTCNYVAPSIGDGEHAIFSITEFSLGEGGHFEDNLARWKSLFRTNEGAPVKPIIETITVNGHDALIAYFQGEYMGAGAAWHKRDHMMLVAEVQEESGNIYFKLIGPASTVQAHRKTFEQFLHSIKSSPRSP